MAKKLKRTEFIDKAIKKHGNKYDYSKVDYINSQTKVCIICPEHGEFWQTPNNHLNGKGCSKCTKQCTDTESFINIAIKIHGNKYDYSKVDYINSQTKVCIICPEHGEFWQTPGNHLAGKGCNKCKYITIHNKRAKNKKDFIQQAIKVHGNRYDYSRVEYFNNNTKVCIICPEHGEFWQNASSHLQGCECPKCKGGIKYSQQEFIEKAKNIHGDKYDYSKVNYINCKTKVCIICNEIDEFGEKHGEFWQIPSNHLKGCGCSKCANKILTQDIFIQRCNLIHNNKYNYSKIEFINGYTKVCIICPEHGEFWQTPSKHLSGQGCPACRKSKLEEQVEIFLKKYKIKYETQKQFKWLRYINLMSLDFYLPDYNIAIECQGKQHFLEKCTFSNNNKETLELVQERDETKKRLCKENNVKLLYYSTMKIKFPYKVITNETDLLIEILKGAIV